MDGRKVKIILKNGDVYHGVVVEQTHLVITIIDRFNDKVTISIDSISVLKEVLN